jgi:hypothetical protein
MAYPDDSQIPEEILKAEKKLAEPVRPETPGTFGLPGLPPAILDLIFQYGPVIVLAGAVFNGFNAFGGFISLSGSNSAAPSTLVPLSLFLSVAAAVLMAASYIWLTEKRRMGWNTLAIALIVQFTGQFLMSGAITILYSGIEIIITAYIMLQIRDHYSE